MFTVPQISNWIKAEHANATEASPARLFSSLNVTRFTTLKEAGPNDIAFFFSKHYQNDLMATKAGVIVTGSAFVDQIAKAGLPQWKTSVFLACADPYLAMGIVSSHFSKQVSAHDHQVQPKEQKIHPTAVVSALAKIGKNVHIGAGTVVEDNAVIHDGVVLYPQCYVGPGCEIGEGSVLFPKVTFYENTIVGKRCRFHSGVVVGADGFGYAPVLDPETKLPIDHQKIYHLGRVRIGDDVEMGSNSTIDRGTLGETIIHNKVKIDNLVQIGHNCEVHEGAILCGTAGMAGSSSLGKFVYVGANAGTGNQVHVGDYSKLTAYTGVAKDVEPHSELGGVPARPLSDYFRILAIQNKLLREQKRGRKS